MERTCHRMASAGLRRGGCRDATEGGYRDRQWRPGGRGVEGTASRPPEQDSPYENCPVALRRSSDAFPISRAGFLSLGSVGRIENEASERLMTAFFGLDEYQHQHSDHCKRRHDNSPRHGVLLWSVSIGAVADAVFLLSSRLSKLGTTAVAATRQIGFIDVSAGGIADVGLK